MRARSMLVLALPALFCASGAFAQSAQPAPADSACPMLPVGNLESNLRWTSLRTDNALLCRALRNDNGSEAFALTMTKKVGFKLESDMREEKGNIQGQQVWWHRSEIAGRPTEVVRETLLKLSSDRVVHIYIRSGDASEVARYQQLVQTLQFAAPDIAKR
jgi:hypothetical protein